MGAPQEGSFSDMEIKFSGVTKIFQPDIIALEDIYMQVEKGEFVYLVGRPDQVKRPSCAVLQEK